MRLTASAISALLVAIMITAGCSSGKEIERTKKLVYFKNLNEEELKTISQQSLDPVLQKGDLLYLTVSTNNDYTQRLFNQPNLTVGATAANTLQQQVVGYLIDANGNANFPMLGQTKAAGLKKSELYNKLYQTVKAYVTDTPVVNLRILNFRITVLGEVMKPGTYSFDNERATLLDALGICGDLTPFGKRENIRIIRTSAGERTTGLLNLNDGNVFSSPYFQLKQNDVIYVEMNDNKLANVDQKSFRNISLITAILSTLAIVVTALSTVIK